MPSFDDYIVFVDESGDRGMESIDANYPVFVLVFCVYAKETYADRVDPRPQAAQSGVRNPGEEVPPQPVREDRGMGLKVFP